jgi:ribonuclease Y
MTAIAILYAIAAGCAGIIAGYFLRIIYALGQKGSIEVRIKEMLGAARLEADEIRASAEKEAAEVIKQVRMETKEKEEGLRKVEERLVSKENTLDRRHAELEQQLSHVQHKIEEVKDIKAKAEEHEKERRVALERSASLSATEAKEELLAEVEKEQKEDIMMRLRKLELAGQESYDRKARDIIVSAIHRYGNAVPGDVFSSTVAIPNEETKGKVIGKEGRNVKAFERMTGVDILIDDTPGAIVISSHDPVRRQIARVALEELIKDGRIQPSRIEQAVEKASKDVQKIMRDQGEAAAFEVGILNLDPKLTAILGRLYFRSSYGQNVLQHSVEMAHIAGMIAEELGANVKVAKAGALLHDIGKAVDHEVQGSHVEIGRRILQKFDVDEEVIKAMQAHHEEYPYETVESIIVQVADAVSGARPGARRDTAEQYMKRLQDLEAIATRHTGVEKAYALQAGREVRIFVKADETDDLEARKLARNVALDIEKELRYPGEIRVVVIRETRVIEVAR